MPIYEYVCDRCGHSFELMQKMNDNTIQVCEKCGAKKAHRIISQTTFMLKGTGWYATDYAGKKAHGVKESSSATSSEKKSSSKSDKATTSGSEKKSGSK